MAPAHNSPLILLITLAVVTARNAIADDESASLAEPQSRIFGGQNATEGQFPYQVLVTRAGDDAIAVCGGAIISRNYVVTAARCANG